MEGGTEEGTGATAAAFSDLRATASSAGGSGNNLDELERKMKSSVHPEEDDFVPELHRNVHPRERPDWEETLSAMARGADVPEIPGELPLKTCGSTASMKVKHVKKSTNPGLLGCDNIHRLPFTKGHFPKMAECAHFHYENVEFGSIQLSLSEEQNEVTRNGCESKELVYLVQIACQGKSWIVKRSYEDFRVLDKHLHLCIYDRRFSQLSELPRSDSLKDSPESVTQMLMAYLSRLSAIAGNKINCGPALTWMEIDNKGNHLLVHEESSINTPAVGAAHVIKRYTARAPDELSLEVGDIVSVIDMPPKVLSTWWRGKHGFQVGLFPGHCVELINQKVPQSVTNSVPKPVSPAHGARPASWSYFPPLSKKHGKLITFLRTFMKSRPTKQKLKQRGILKERVFGCDLGEHLLNSGFEVPQVLQSCTSFIERYGIVDGIYRLSGVASNIQRLRHEFDSEHIPDLTKEPYVQDIHSVGSLCKLYFRELPNPLLTYQLYEKFSDAVSAATDEERLIKIHDVIQQLPPPHYRTLEFLMRHLSLLADYCSITNMHAKNLAIVWAPNLLRSKQIESACFSGTAAFMEVRIQSVVVEFILNHVDVLFSSKISAVIQDGAAASLSRPKSLLVSSPSTKLLTLEEAQARTQAQIHSPIVTDNKYIEVGEGPAALQGKFHTVIEFPLERKRPPSKMKKSPVGSWRSFFNLGKSSSVSKRKLQRNESEPSEMKAIALKGGRAEGTLRSAKSEESLTSLHAVDGESKLFRPRRPRSSSDALSASFNGEMLGNRCNSYDNLPHDQESEEEDGLLHIPALVSPHSTEDVDLSPPDIGVASLDFDPMSFQCSPPKAEAECPEHSALLDFEEFAQDKVANRKEAEAGSQCQTPGSTTSSEPVSPLQDKASSPFFTLDLSPTEEKAPRPSSSTERVVYAFSPKMGRKLSKSPAPTGSEPVSVPLPGPMSEATVGVSGPIPNASPPAWNRSFGDGEAPNTCPHQGLTTKGDAAEARERHPSEAQKVEPAAAVTAPEVEPPTPVEPFVPNGHSKAVASAQTHPGAVALDSPQDPVPVSSVTLIPPPPPPKNAARMLALALAESAQQASTQSLKRPGNGQAGYPDAGDSAVAGPQGPQFTLPSGFPLDKAYFQSGTPGEPPELQRAIPGGCDGPIVRPVASATAPEDQPYAAPAPEPGDGPHPSAASLGSPPRTDKAETHLTLLADSEKTSRPSPPGDPETDPQAPSFGSPDPPDRYRPRGEEPYILPDPYVDKPHLPPEMAPGPWPLDRALPSAGPPGESSTGSTVTHLTNTQPEATEIIPGESPWGCAGQPTPSEDGFFPSGQPTPSADGFFGTLQRTHRNNRPRPVTPPAQRAVEPQAPLGQIPAAAGIAPNGSLKVRGGVPAPEKPPEPRTADPAPTTWAPAATIAHPGLPVKLREGTRAPPLHLRSESVPASAPYSFGAPIPPTRTLESKMAAAMHANNADGLGASSYHAFAAAPSASPDEDSLLGPPHPQPKHTSLKPAHPVYPWPENSPEPLSPENCAPIGLAPACQYRPPAGPLPGVKPEQLQGYGSRSETLSSGSPRYNTYLPPGKSGAGARSRPCGRMEYGSSASPSVRSACYPDDLPLYPTIRRVQSLHVPPTALIRSVPISRTEVPPDDEPAFCPRPLYPYKPYQSSPARSDYHVTQLQPYFENGRVHYRYSPYSSSAGPCYGAEGPFYTLDAYSTMQPKPSHRQPGRDLTFCAARPQGKNSARHPGPPPRPRASFVGYLPSHEPTYAHLPPPSDARPTYASWDLEDLEKYRLQSIRRESRARQRARGPVLSQYDNIAPLGLEDPASIYVIHLRSKSDPGKTGLLSVAEGRDGRRASKAISPAEGDDRFCRKHPEAELERAHCHGGCGNGQAEKPSLPQKQSSLRSRKARDLGGPPSEHRAHQEASHRALAEARNGPPFPAGACQLDYGPRGPQDPLDPPGYHPLYGPSGQGTLRPSHKEPRLPEDPERPRVRSSAAPERLSRECYLEEEHLARAMATPPKPERSHSLRLHPGPSMEREPGLLYHYHPHGKRQGAVTVLSQYDNVGDCHTLPPPPRGSAFGGGGGGDGPFGPPSFPHPQNRTYATALGQGAFLPTEMSLQSPETHLRAE
ncbi:rho GTPase-activating protein 32 isoform X5 [Ornithorhynchus anatinus]|uniref:Rho GTPase-activating protein 32 n=1 Tax=Ornithorhynchus anatinus TaxID=9258 RepID=A0A6I8NWS5_ORNAN|nr:rho GTPase-activating protein 32 isoform X5 [Ornithorhynchus anatinus]